MVCGTRCDKPRGFHCPTELILAYPNWLVELEKGPKAIGITIYASSMAEARHYDESYGLPRSQVKVVGVPRHDQSWIRRLREHYRGQPTEKGKYIFLASRPVNERTFPPARKIEALQALKTLADQLDCRVLVRLHPLETEFDKGIIESVFEKQVLGKTWSYSTLPPIVAAEGALFAVTLFSSVAIDMLATEVPVIELCDFADLTESPNLVHDNDGRLTSIYQQSGLVLGAANFEQLTLCAAQIRNGRDAVLASLKAAYSRTYASPDLSVELIVQDILAALSQQANSRNRSADSGTHIPYISSPVSELNMAAIDCRA